MTSLDSENSCHVDWNHDRSGLLLTLMSQRTKSYASQPAVTTYIEYNRIDGVENFNEIFEEYEDEPREATEIVEESLVFGHGAHEMVQRKPDAWKAAAGEVLSVITSIGHLDLTNDSCTITGTVEWRGERNRGDLMIRFSVPDIIAGGSEAGDLCWTYDGEYLKRDHGRWVDVSE
jgi:hypothetical protein